MRTRIAKFKVSMPSAHAMLIACAWLVVSSPLPAATVAWWRFEAGPSDVMVPHGAGEGVFAPDIYDYSGNGNHLSVWHTNSTGFTYRSDRPFRVIPSTDSPNNFSVQNNGEYPCMFTQTGTAMQMMTPAAFTIEVSFKPEVGGWRTLVGRDSQGTVGWNTDLPALYLQITPEDAVAIKFCDVSGYWHEAVSSNGLIRGLTYSYTDPWYHLAAVSDGANLSLYLDSDFGYRLVAWTDMTDSGSPNTALTAGTGSGSGWAAGMWSVGRGLYAGAHTDRAYGFIDEVRISDSDRAPEQLLFWRPKIMVTSYSDSGPGSLRAALESAVDGDIIDARGVGGTITLTNGELYVGKSVAILGPGPGKLTVSGDHACRVFNLNSTISKNVLISGLRIANGTGLNGPGGGIYNYRGTLTLTNCALSGNSAVYGGGICNEEGTIALTACTLSTNSTEYYAGGDNFGGGICNLGTMTLTACTLSANSAHDRGGGIHNGGTMMLETCTLSANSATNYGGGICNSGVLTLAACTLSANSAEYGGGMFNELQLTVGGTILNAGAKGANVVNGNLGWLNYTGYNLTSDASSDGFFADPMLGPLQDNGGPTWTHALLPGSPAIGAGPEDSTLLTDQRGFPRKVGTLVDIGAYEVQQPIGAPSLADLSRSTNGAIQFNFTNAPGVQFAVQATTNIALPMTSWPVLTNALIERPPGFYQFSDSSATNNPQRFYRVRWEHDRPL